jgi:hypothetical protein
VPPGWTLPGLLVLGFGTFFVGLAAFNRFSEDIGEYL